MLNRIKNRKKKISFIIVALFLLINLLLVIDKGLLLEHNHCEEENCPICEIVYIVNQEFKNISSGGIANLGLFVLLAVLVLFKAFNQNILVNEYSLVKEKVRLND